MKKQPVFLLLCMLILTLSVSAQTRNTQLTIQVSSVGGDNLNGQPITLMQTDYQVSYGTLTLNSEGVCKLKVYAGNHQLTIERNGFNTQTHDFNVAENETEKTISVTLTEKTRDPFAITAEVGHNIFTGKDSILLSWNKEAPAFFDDFESYEPFAVTFGEWTGIDGDLEAAAPLIGSYPNRGVMQYAQIINPLTVNPTWWYDYPILRPYDGQQYVGFTRTSSGNANNDWLISPTITVGTNNVLTFMGKAADRYKERFMVYVTTKLDNPGQSDFVRLDKDNYETADYTGWCPYTYDLSTYAGKQVKLAIRYISHYNSYGSFMLMVDNFYVGQAEEEEQNPNETFHIYLDGQEVGTTTDKSITLKDVAAGSHTIGIQAVYLQAQSNLVTLPVEISSGNYARVTFEVQANSILSPNGQQLAVTSLTTSETYTTTVADGKVILPSLPYGDYVVNIAEGAFVEYQQTITVSKDMTVPVTLNDNIIKPYNITATADENGLYTLRWNQKLQFSDSFEDYDDFATGSFGDWLTVDVDKQPVYPIALGSQSNIISFPGSGTANNPTAIAPMVFNPWKTTPAMLPTDEGIKAPTGDKTVIFFSAQRGLSDKWLISPMLDIHDNYALNVTAKGYSASYPESMEFCISDGSTLPTDFTALSKVDELSTGMWTIYQTDLADYAGQTVRLAVHYTSYDAFLAQVDDFTVGPANGQSETVDYGNVISYEVWLDGVKIGEPTTPQFTLTSPLSEGSHTIAIYAIYQNGKSEKGEYIINTTGIVKVTNNHQQGPAVIYDLQGRQVQNASTVLPHGIYVVRQNGQTLKIRK